MCNFSLVCRVTKKKEEAVTNEERFREWFVLYPSEKVSSVFAMGAKCTVMEGDTM